jgi:hypothetical protein
MSEATRALIERLRHLTTGELVTYAELQAVAGVDVQAHRHLLYTAMNYLREEEGMVFDPDIGTGIVRLTEPGKTARGRRRRGYVFRFARKTSRELGTADVASMTDLERYKHLAELSISDAITLAAHENTARQIETQQNPQPVLIDPTQYKDVFKGL